MFKFNNKDTRTTSMASYVILCSSVSFVDFEQVNAGWAVLKGNATNKSR